MKQELILKAVAKRISYFGINKTTVTDIAKAAGVSVAALYYYFPDKNEAVLATLEDPVNNYLETLGRQITLLPLSVQSVLHLALWIRMEFLKTYCWFDYLHPMALNSAASDILSFISDCKRREVAAYANVIAAGSEMNHQKGSRYTELASRFISAIDHLAVANPLIDADGLLMRQQLYTKEFVQYNNISGRDKVRSKNKTHEGSY